MLANHSDGSFATTPANSSVGFTKRSDWHYDITRSLEGVSTRSKPSVSIKDGQVVPFISASFLFKDEEGKAGQSVRAQLSIKSNAHPGSAPVALTSIYVSFSGSVNSISLKHQENRHETQQRSGRATLFAVPLTSEANDNTNSEPTASEEADSGVALLGSTDLTLIPGHTIVLNMDIPLREPGETRANSLLLNFESESFDLQQSLTLREDIIANIWYISAAATKHSPHPHPLTVRVLPRPPKMEVKCPGWKEQYYTDEPLSLEFEVENGEDIEALAKLDIILFGEKPPAFTVEIPGHESQTSSSVRSEESKLSAAPLGNIASSRSLTVALRLPAIERSSRYDLTLKVTYFLSTNPGTPISQTAVFQLNFVNPFEANYDLLPRVHPDPWPSLFDYETVNALPDDETNIVPPSKGISQSWSLVTRYASFASEPLRVVDIDIAIDNPPSSSIRCTTSNKRTNLPASGQLIHPKTIEEAVFDLVAQKYTIDDRSHAPLDISLIIKWTRHLDPPPSSPPESANTTSFPIPRFTIFGTEPRVLATVSHHRLSPSSPQLLLTLTVTIENGSNHFLTFGLSMEPSEQFAFSGPKLTTVSLLPVSRRSVEYRLLPLSGGGAGGGENGEQGQEGEDEGGWWIRPGLVVRDKYFQKVLRVVAGGEGIRGGREGFEVWVPSSWPGPGPGPGADDKGEEKGA